MIVVVVVVSVLKTVCGSVIVVTTIVTTVEVEVEDTVFVDANCLPCELDCVDPLLRSSLTFSLLTYTVEAFTVLTIVVVADAVTLRQLHADETWLAREKALKQLGFATARFAATARPNNSGVVVKTVVLVTVVVATVLH